MSTAIVMSAHNKAHYLDTLLRQTRATAPGAELVLVDDGSTDGTGDILRRHADTFLRTDDVWEVLANNAGLRATGADHVALVQDDDFFLVPGWLDLCVGLMRQEGVDVLGGSSTGYNYFIQDALKPVPEMGNYDIDDVCHLSHESGAVKQVATKAGRFNITRTELLLVVRARTTVKNGVVSAPTVPVVACDATVRSPLILSRRAIDRIGLLDEAFAPLTYDDHDFCLRAKSAGLRVAFTSVPHISRFSGGSSALYTDPDRKAFFLRAVNKNLETLVRKHIGLIGNIWQPTPPMGLARLRFEGALTADARAALEQASAGAA